MNSPYDDLDTVKERFFGWLPKKKNNRIFLILNLLFFAFGIFVWPWLPAFRIGIFPAPYIYHLILTIIASAMWYIYTEKFWYAWDDEIEGENERGEKQE